MSQRIFFSAFLILWLASRASADGGDDFASNLASDLGPIIALFGERVVMQFMSQAMGIADCILLAVAPIGAITTVVSAIRVAGPAWLKSFIGRARENLAAAEVEVMSSTSRETCELWNGHSVVRCPGSANIYQFICLVPKNYNPSKGFNVECKALNTDAQKMAEKNHNENTELLTPIKRAGSTYIRQSFEKSIISMSGKLKQVFHPHANKSPHSDPESQQKSSIDPSTRNSDLTRDDLRDVPTTKYSENEEGLKIIVIQDTDGSAPNLLLNCHDRVGRSEIYGAAVIGLILQLGAVVYFGFITYYRPIQDTFLKDGKRVVKYAFPCAAVGTLLLVLGLFICSWVVGKSTKETYYKADNHQMYVVWLQKDHTVSDQVFKPFAVYPTSKREYITLSRRNIKNRPNEFGELIDLISDKLFKGSRMAKLFNSYFKREVKMGDKNGQPLYWPLESITFIGALISLIGFVSQFIGMRGLNWTASIVQLGITMVVTILRVIVRRGLGKPPAHTPLNPKFELDWFVLSFGRLSKAPWANYIQAERDPANQNKDTRDETPPKWEIRTRTGGELTHTDSDQSVEDSEPHRIMLMRKDLGKLSKWRSPILEEAIHLSRAIEAVANTFLNGQSKVESATSTGSNRQSKDETVASTGLGEQSKVESVAKANLNGQAKESYIWSIPAIYTEYNSAESIEGKTVEGKTVEGKTVEGKTVEGKTVEGKIYVTISKDEPHGWRVDETEIEAILSLWLYSTSSTDFTGNSRPRNLRVYELDESEKRLTRDLEWWMPENIPQSFKRYPENELAELVRKKSERTVVGYEIEDGGAKRSTDNAAQPDPMKNYLVLECQDNQQRLFSRELFCSFMRAIAKMPEVDIASASSAHPLSSSTMSEGWKQMKLKNEIISGLAKKLEKIGFGSLLDIYVDLIIPLSLEHKLTNVENIIDDVTKGAHEYGRTLQWENLVDACFYLLDLALRFDLEKESSPPRAMAVCLGFLYRLHHEAKLQEAEGRREEEPTIQLERLKGRLFKDYPKISDYFSAELPAELKFLAMSFSMLASPDNDNSTSLPFSFRVSNTSLELMEESESGQVLPIQDLKTLEKTDAFGWSLLHYVASLTLASIKIDSKCQPIDEYLSSRDLMGWTLLHHACFSGNKELVNVLLKHGARIEMVENDGITPMHCAVQSGNAEIIQELIKHKKNTTKSKRYVDHNERHPIHWAAVEGNVEIVRLMKDEVGLRDRFGWTPLHLAAIYEHEELLRHFFEDHIEAMEVGDNELRTPLHLAVENEAIAAVEILIQAGAKVNTIANHGLTPLHVAAKQKKNYILEMLLEHGANIEAMDLKGRTPFYLSVEDGEIETIQMLIENGANINVTTKDGRTPLHVALSRGQDGLEAAKILLEAHADVNTKAEDGATGMHVAAECGSLFEILHFLPTESRKSLDIDATDEFGQTPLLITIYKADWEATKLLLEMGADVNADKRSGYTPVLGAVTEQKEDILQLLLAKEAKVNDADGDGFSALHLAILNGNQRIFQALLNANADIDAAVSLRDDTPLHIAVRMGQTEIVQTLLNRGANTRALNFRGFSPLQQALYSGGLTAVQILVEHDKKSTIKAALQKNQEGNTPLHTLAAWARDEDTACKMLEQLLSIGPEIGINAKNNGGDTPLDFALITSQETKHRQFITQLLESGAEPGTELTKTMLRDWRNSEYMN